MATIGKIEMTDGIIPESLRYGELSNEKLLDAQAHIWKHIFSFINSMSLNCAIQLGIIDIIHKHGGPMSLSKLVEALPIDKAKSQCIHRLMRLLVHSKFFVKVNIFDDEEEEEEECYWLTLASFLLLRDSPLTHAPFVQLMSDPILAKASHYMSEWLVSGQHDSFEIAHGRMIWEHMGQDLRLSNLLNESMSCDTRLVMPILLKDHKHMFESVELIVDVGGGIGTTAKAIVDVLKGTKCIVLELPHVVASCESTNNLAFVGGDMFESVPQGDLVLLKWVLHAWSDEDCVRILNKCKEAITGNTKGRAKVMIIDMVLNDHGQEDDNVNVIEDAQLLLDVAAMTYTNGKERSKREWAKLFMETGFTSYKFSPILGVRSVIEVYP